MISGDLITKYFVNVPFNFRFIVNMLASDNVTTAEWIFMKLYEVLRKFCSPIKFWLSFDE